MMKVTIEELEAYLLDHYRDGGIDQSLFMKLVEEVGEVAEVLNKKAGRKSSGNEDLTAQLGNELADVIHYAVAIAALNGLDMNKFIMEKDKSASVKYHHRTNLEQFAAEKRAGNLNRKIEEGKMDISFKTDDQRFNYRVCAMMISDGKILSMRDERSPYFYLPGGRVTMGETAEHAVIREVQEEIGITPEIVRPLWLNQAFFTEDVDNLRYHELCVYFLMDITGTDLLERGRVFSTKEGRRTHTFEWLPFDSLKDAYFYPQFLKKDIYNLPDEFILRTELE